MKLSATESVADAEAEVSHEEAHKRVLASPDLEPAETAVLNNLTSAARRKWQAASDFVPACKRGSCRQ